MKAGSKTVSAAETGRISADIDIHGKVEFGQLSRGMTSDRASAVHRKTAQLVDTEHGHAVPRVQVHTHLTPAYTRTSTASSYFSNPNPNLEYLKVDWK